MVDPHAPDGGRCAICTILTTAANAAISGLHDRMPIILERDNEDEWLDTSTPRDRLGDILAGLPAEQTALTEVGFYGQLRALRRPRTPDPPAPSAQAALF